MDSVAGGTATWEKVDGSQGALTSVSSFTTSFAKPTTVGRSKADAQLESDRTARPLTTTLWAWKAP